MPLDVFLCHSLSSVYVSLSDLCFCHSVSCVYVTRCPQFMSPVSSVYATPCLLFMLVVVRPVYVTHGSICMPLFVPHVACCHSLCHKPFSVYITCPLFMSRIVLAIGCLLLMSRVLPVCVTACPLFMSRVAHVCLVR